VLTSSAVAVNIDDTNDLWEAEVVVFNMFPLTAKNYTIDSTENADLGEVIALPNAPDFIYVYRAKLNVKSAYAGEMTDLWLECSAPGADYNLTQGFKYDIISGGYVPNVVDSLYNGIYCEQLTVYSVGMASETWRLELVYDTNYPTTTNIAPATTVGYGDIILFAGVAIFLLSFLPLGLLMNLFRRHKHSYV